MTSHSRTPSPTWAFRPGAATRHRTIPVRYGPAGDGAQNNGAGWLPSFGDGSAISSQVVPATALGLGLVALFAGVAGMVRRPARRTRSIA